MSAQLRLRSDVLSNRQTKQLQDWRTASWGRKDWFWTHSSRLRSRKSWKGGCWSLTQLGDSCSHSSKMKSREKDVLLLVLSSFSSPLHSPASKPREKYCPKWAGSSHINQCNQENPYGYPRRSKLSGQFSTKLPFSDDSKFCQGDKTSQSSVQTKPFPFCNLFLPYRKGILSWESFCSGLAKTRHSLSNCCEQNLCITLNKSSCCGSLRMAFSLHRMWIFTYV